jgi:hypothetical protein
LNFIYQEMENGFQTIISTNTFNTFNTFWKGVGRNGHYKDNMKIDRAIENVNDQDAGGGSKVKNTINSLS